MPHSDLQRSMSVPHTKYIYPIQSLQNSQSITASVQVQNLTEFLPAENSQISSSKLSKLRMSEVLDVIHPRAEILSFC